MKGALFVVPAETESLSSLRRQNLNLENSIKSIIDFLISWMVAVWKEPKYRLEVQPIFPSGGN